jgi:hypothetical protein
MRLNLLFIVMYLFTFFAYPVVFLHGKLLQFSIARNVLVIAPEVPGG